MVRTAPQGLEVFRPMANPEEPNKTVMTIDYYSVEVTEGPLINQINPTRERACMFVRFRL